MTDSNDAQDALKNDPTLRDIGAKIEDAKDDARKIFPASEKDHGIRNGADEDSADDDLGGAAPVP
jgi:hypothetical protein